MRWAKLLLALSEGNASGVASLEQMDCDSFYYLYEAWIDRQDAISEAYKKKG